MPRRARHHEARRLGEPSGALFSLRRTGLIAYERHQLEERGNLLFQIFAKGETFLLPFAVIPLPIDAAGRGIAGLKEGEGPGAFLFGLIRVGPVLRLGWPDWGQPWTRRQRGLLVQGEHQRIIVTWTRVELDHAEMVAENPASRRCLGSSPR
jgi:hypothetical protein